MKSQVVTIHDRRRNFDNFKSDKVQEQSEKILSLFDDDSYSEEESFVTRSTNNSCSIFVSAKLFTFILSLTLLLNFVSWRNLIFDVFWI